MAALEEMAAVKGSVSAPRARGLLDHFNKGTTILGLVLGQEIFLKLEGLNRSLQGRAVTIGGMLKAVECTKKAVVAGRTDDAFMSLYSRAVELTTSFDLESIKLPHVRKASNRYGGPAKSHIPSSVEEYFRVQFFCASDTAVTQLDDRFHQEGLGYLAKLEEHLLTGKCHEAVARYPELDAELLQVQLAMMKASYQFTSCQEASQLLTTMVPEVRRLFNQVETLIRLLLVVPASSCEAERSFSALRRLKTWLRSTMTQCRLNGVSVCHVHREKLQAINREQIAVAFIGITHCGTGTHDISGTEQISICLRYVDKDLEPREPRKNRHSFTLPALAKVGFFRHLFGDPPSHVGQHLLLPFLPTFLLHIAGIRRPLIGRGPGLKPRNIVVSRAEEKQKKSAFSAALDARRRCEIGQWREMSRGEFTSCDRVAEHLGCQFHAHICEGRQMYVPFCEFGGHPDNVLLILEVEILQMPPGYLIPSNLEDHNRFKI
ncbi:hypothetical protein N1851_007869 [Merluccius polli]|uniref:HAT C-terminal dimerisation domain-containing protein n=1 Tax=Merluccius polli TaxID=89951 RepID=A0AA47P4X0_MERPO|nr:hypothetical protein N1851_007869 [Merluccius polli]